MKNTVRFTGPSVDVWACGRRRSCLSLHESMSAIRVPVCTWKQTASVDTDVDTGISVCSKITVLFNEPMICLGCPPYFCSDPVAPYVQFSDIDLRVLYCRTDTPQVL